MSTRGAEPRATPHSLGKRYNESAYQQKKKQDLKKSADEGRGCVVRKMCALRAVEFFLGCVWLCPTVFQAQQQGMSSIDREQVAQMLRDARDEVKKHYYDPKIKGIDWDARYQKYAAQIPNARELGDGFRIVAGFLMGLDDSHTFFDPPHRKNEYDYGYLMGLVGDAALVTHVRPKSDAEAKLHVGDQVLTINGIRVDRKGFHTVEYYFNNLAPQDSLRLIVQSPTGEQHRVIVNAAIKEGKQMLNYSDGGGSDLWDAIRHDENFIPAFREKIVENGDVAIWRLPIFFADPSEIVRFTAKARKHATLILDLRGNPGGSVDTLEFLAGALFGKEVKIADPVGRNAPKPIIAKHVADPFTGKLIVLVDGNSASAAEMLARVVQLEHRGIVIGDKSAGAVMEAKTFGDHQGTQFVTYYGFNVTVADVLMSDGKSLEKIGVIPDEPILPTAADVAVGRDPVLAHAAELAGLKLDPIAAGKMFPFEWPPF